MWTCFRCHHAPSLQSKWHAQAHRHRICSFVVDCSFECIRKFVSKKTSKWQLLFHFPCINEKAHINWLTPTEGCHLIKIRTQHTSVRTYSMRFCENISLYAGASRPDNIQFFFETMEQNRNFNCNEISKVHCLMLSESHSSFPNDEAKYVHFVWCSMLVSIPSQSPVLPS